MFLVSKFVILSMALASAAAAQQTASVAGTVTNLVTRAPIPRAHIVFRGGKTFGTLTNEEGKFSISGLPPSFYAVSAERIGFTSRNRRTVLLGVDLHAGDNSCDLKLIPLGSISGRVLDTDGEPVQSMHVVAEGSNENGTATTDTKGQYRIGGLAPGKYRVKVLFQPQGRPPEIRTDGSRKVQYRSTYYPGAPTSKEASRVTVAAGAEVAGIDITLLTTPIVRIGGRVLDIPAAAQGVSVDVTYAPTQNSWERFGVICAKDGRLSTGGLTRDTTSCARIGAATTRCNPRPSNWIWERSTSTTWKCG